MPPKKDEQPSAAPKVAKTPPPVDPTDPEPEFEDAQLEADALGVGAPRAPFGDPNAPLTQEDKDRMKRLAPFVSRITVAKGLHTRRCNEAERVLAFPAGGAPPTPHLLEELKGALRKINEATDRVQLAYDDIVFEDVDENVPEYLSRLHGQLSKSVKIVQALNDNIIHLEHTFKLKVSSGPFGAARASDDEESSEGSGHSHYSGGGVRKPNEALKPATLNASSTPVELHAWCSLYEAYFSSSRMEHAPLREQQAYFKACLAPSLLAAIDSRIVADTPIFKLSALQRAEIDASNRSAEEKAKRDKSIYPPKLIEVPTSCMELLQEQFLNLYPIFARRLDFFRFNQKQPNQQLFTDWVKDLHKHGDQCQLDQLTVNNIYVFRYLTGISDGKLAQELMKLDNPTYQQLAQTAQKYEVALRCLAQVPGVPGSQRTLAYNAAAAGGRPANASAPRGQQNHRPAQQAAAQRQSRPPAQGGQRQQSQVNNSNSGKQQQKQFRCFRCGNGKADHDCRAVDAVCKFCQKKGHFAGVCNSKARQNGNQARASQATSQPAPSTAAANVAAAQ